MKLDSTAYAHGGTQRDKYTADDVEHCACPLCGADDPELILTERDVLGVVCCRGCSLIYINPRLKEPEKVYWGDPEAYFAEARLIFEGRMPHHRDPNYEHELSIIARYKPTGRFLDVGTNMGFFLRMARGRGWELHGVEPSPALAEMARRHFGLDVRNAYLSDAGFEDDWFDVVSMTDVFEHVTDPRGMLADIRRIIKPDGVLLIKVPNGNYNLLKLKLASMSGRAAGYDLFDSYEHVVHYTTATLKKMLEVCGFRPLRFYYPPPVQVPVWHHYTGQYYQYPSPAVLDLKHTLMRKVFHWIGQAEAILPHSPWFPSAVATVAMRK